MPGRKKHAVRKGHGSMCNICGKNCGRGGPLKKHVESTHEINYEDYKYCFYGDVKTVLSDNWDDTVKTKSGQKVVVHILVRRFIGDPGKRGATRNVRAKK